MVGAGLILLLVSLLTPLVSPGGGGAVERCAPLCGLQQQALVLSALLSYQSSECNQSVFTNHARA